MRYWLILAVAIALILSLGSCDSREETFKKRAITRLERDKSMVANHITYIYDPKVDICYAVLWAGSREGLLTVVPYEKVKEYAHVIEYGCWDEENWEAYRRAKKEVFK